MSHESIDKFIEVIDIISTYQFQTINNKKKKKKKKKVHVEKIDIPFE